MSVTHIINVPAQVNLTISLLTAHYVYTDQQKLGASEIAAVVTVVEGHGVQF